MKKLLCFSLIVGILFCLIKIVIAGQLVYEPINPSFGGSSLNGTWMLNSAQIQDPYGYMTKKAKPTPPKDPLETFQQQITDRIFYNLSSQIVRAAFGEEGLETGHYTIGDYDVDIDSGTGGITVKIIDNRTSNSTIVEVPYY